MPRYAYVNGAYLPHKEAAVHIEDRGFQFADGVYEVIACIHGHLADERGHMDRLKRSLSELGMDMPMQETALKLIMHELLRRNRIQDALVYIQVTRGAAKRDFPFPDKDTVPQSVVMTTWPFRFDAGDKMKKGIKAVTVPDIRWKRRDIKSVALLPQALAKQQAVEQGATEAWMVDDDGYITEGASSNTWIVKDGKLITRQATHDILRGVTRTALEKISEELQIKLEERKFKPEEVYEAEEAFTSSAGALIAPVVELDGHKIGNGKPGQVTLRLHEEYMAYVEGLRGEQLRWSA